MRASRRLGAARFRRPHASRRIAARSSCGAACARSRCDAPQHEADRERRALGEHCIPVLRCQTADLVPAARLRPGGEKESHREGWAERRQAHRCCAEHRLGLHMTRQARRLRGALRPHNAGTRAFRRSTVAVFGGGPRFRLRHYPPQPVQRCSSQPSRSAWRAGPSTSRSAVTSRSRRTPHLAPHSGIVSRTRPSMSKTKRI